MQRIHAADESVCQKNAHDIQASDKPRMIRMIILVGGSIIQVGKSSYIVCTVLFSTVQNCTVMFRIVQYCQHCSVMFRIVQYFSSVQYCSVLFISVQYCAVLFSTVHYCSVLLSIFQYCTVLFSTAQYCTVLGSTFQECQKGRLGQFGSQKGFYGCPKTNHEY